MTHDSDVCVIGGGPGGLFLTLLLLRSGWRVRLLERSPSVDRAYRGEILQPGGQELLDGAGVLDDAMRRGCLDLGSFELSQNGRTLITSDYRSLPGPCNRLLSLPQAHLIEALLEACSAQHGFTYAAGSSIREYEQCGPDAVSVTYRNRDGDHRLSTRCLVGADGRQSTVRRLSGTSFERDESAHFDVLWCKLPLGTGDSGRVRILRNGGPPVFAYDSWPGQLQLGVTVQHGKAAELLAGGVQAVVGLLQAALPEHAATIAASVRERSDVTVLDAFSGVAESWEDDRLVLLGDAAHTHSPLGAQGINLALGDAAALHPVLHGALVDDTLDAATLGEFSVVRRPEIEGVLTMQTHQARGLLADHRGPGRILAPMIARAVSASPIGAAMTRRVAYGRRQPPLRTDLFEELPLRVEAQGVA